jgi:hypothetical protein
LVSIEKVHLMCSKVTCKQCGKPTYSGCGEHIEYALGDVPLSERCAGHEGEIKEPGFIGKLFGAK